MKSKIVKNIRCSHCECSNYYKKGIVFGEQRYYCKSCNRHFTMKPKRYSKAFKSFAVLLYLNNVGIRKIAKIGLMDKIDDKNDISNCYLLYLGHFLIMVKKFAFSVAAKT